MGLLGSQVAGPSQSVYDPRLWPRCRGSSNSRLGEQVGGAALLLWCQAGPEAHVQRHVWRQGCKQHCIRPPPSPGSSRAVMPPTTAPYSILPQQQQQCGTSLPAVDASPPISTSRLVVLEAGSATTQPHTACATQMPPCSSSASRVTAPHNPLDQLRQYHSTTRHNILVAAVATSHASCSSSTVTAAAPAPAQRRRPDQHQWHVPQWQGLLQQPHQQPAVPLLHCSCVSSGACSAGKPQQELQKGARWRQQQPWQQ